MTTGVVAASCVFPASSGINSGAYDSRALNPYPFGGWVSSLDLAGPLTLHIPSIPSYADTGINARGFGDDWFNRIHITTGLLSLGNIVSNVTKVVGLWNAWLYSPQTLNSLTSTGSGGITVSGQPTPPLTFAANQQLNWTFTVTPDGPPNVNAFFTWAFADGENVLLQITGNRITPWSLTPDWSNPVNERFEFKTDVMIAWSGAEMRRALRIAPRRTFSFDVQMYQQDRRVIEAALFAWSTMVWALPIWPDGQKLTTQVNPGALTITCDTVNRDFVAGGLAIFISSAATYEVVQVLAVAATSVSLVNPVAGTWPVGSKFYPVRSARLASYPKITREFGQFASAKPEFLIIDPCDWPSASGLASYRSYPVLEDSPDDSQNDDTTYEREAVTIDGDSTGVFEVDDTANIGFPAYTHNWFLKGRTARANFRALLYLLKGRQGEIWVPTYQSDLELVASVSSSQTTINVQMSEYTLYLANQLNRQDIRIELTSGAIFYRRVTGSQVVDVNTEQLSIDSALGVAITPSQIRRISYMALCRLNADTVDMQHYTAADGLALASTQWRALNHNV